MNSCSQSLKGQELPRSFIIKDFEPFILEYCQLIFHRLDDQLIFDQLDDQLIFHKLQELFQIIFHLSISYLLYEELALEFSELFLVKLIALFLAK